MQKEKQEVHKLNRNKSIPNEALGSLAFKA